MNKTCETSSNEFGFPYSSPYAIQIEFMKKLYNVLNEGKIGLFESPTGTGKSLSIICGSLSWLKTYHDDAKTSLSNESNKLDDDLNELEGEAARGDWVKIHHRKKKVESEKEKVKHLLDLIAKKEERTQYLKDRKLNGRMLNKRKYDATHNKKRKATDDDNENNDVNRDGGLFDDHLVQYADADDTDDDESAKEEKTNDDNESDKTVKPKIFYCSRTHSQLTQFVNEVKRTQFASAFRLVVLGSRVNLCVNPAVNRCKNASVLNDRCLELQKNTGKEKKCPYMNSKAIEELRDDILTEVHDIEEMALVGKHTQSCSYYASRLSIPEADIVILPYNVLLHAKTRNAYGITLKDSIVIVDEAHNLMGTIASVHSSCLNSEQLKECAAQLSLYLDRYKTRLNAKNLLYIKQLIFLVNSLHNYVNNTNNKKSESKPGGGSDDTNQMLTVVQFRIAAQIDNLNLYKLSNYCEKSQLAKKLFGFSTSVYYHKQKIGLKGENVVQKSNERPIPTTTTSTVKTTATIAKATGTSAFLDRLKQSSQKVIKKRQKTTTNAAEIIQQQKQPNNGTNKGTQRIASALADQAQQEPPKPSSPLYQILDFIKSLTNPSADGRVLLTRTTVRSPASSSTAAPSSANNACTTISSLKYLLLNPSNQFKDIVDECRSLVLAGGTMQPFNEFTDLLFKPIGVPSQRIVNFACGHVIPDKNLLAIAVSRGPSTNGPLFDFSYSQRMNSAVIDETGRVLHNLANVAPGGIVVFFTSYEYEQKIYSHWERGGLIKQLESTGKRVFREPRKANEVNQILTEYARAIRVSRSTTVTTPGGGGNNNSNNSGKNSCGGAFLFSVVGGKMSEGINFSDDLGRCVVMVGLPYANIGSPELTEKMAYLEREQGQGKGRFYYENLCMKAVNQSIGRAIRHQNDYSVILLLDQRYCSRKDIQQALPRWIASRLQIHHQQQSIGFNTTLNEIKQFFADKR